MKTTSMCLNCQEFYITYWPDHIAREVCKITDTNIELLAACPKTGKKPNVGGQMRIDMFEPSDV
ncbi:MAG: hypothetical protein WC489_06305 [Patescibacteria group bacterium]